MLWLVAGLSCRSEPPAVVHVDERPVSTLCSEWPEEPVLDPGGGLPPTEAGRVAWACHGPRRGEAIEALAALPKASHLPLYDLRRGQPEVKAAMVAIDTPAARRLLQPGRLPTPRGRVPSWSRAQLAAAPYDVLREAASDPGGRWPVLDVLDTLPPAQHAAAVRGLLDADWTMQRAPDRLVDIARVHPRDPAAWSLLAQVGEEGPLLEALADPDRVDEGLRAVVSGRVSPSDDVLVAARTALGEPVTWQALSPYLEGGADPTVLEALLPSGQAMCHALRTVGRQRVVMGREWVVAGMVHCPRQLSVPRTLDAMETALDLSQVEGPEATRSRLMEEAVDLAPDRVELLAAVLDRDDVVGLRLALGQVERVGGEGLVPRVMALTRHAELEVRAAAMNALATQWPGEARAVLVEMLDDVDLRRGALERLLFLNHPERTQILMQVGSDPAYGWAGDRVRKVLDVK